MSNVVIVIIGGNTVSADVLDIDTWGNRLTNIGACRLRIDNLNNNYGGVFAANAVIEIWVNGTQIWEGKVDNVMPYLPVKGYATNELLVTGRDYGRYLRDYYDTGDYGEQQSGDTIDDILDAQGDPLLYTAPGVSPNIKYETKRTWLADAFNEIAEEVGWCYYIDINGRLHYIDVAVGEDSNVDLISDPATPSFNNLLNFTEYETIAFDIKNTIEIYAGSVRDHYSDLNAADFDKTGGAVTDETTIGLKMYGAGSIKVVAGDNDETVWLDFSGAGLYSHVNLDLTKFAQCKVCFMPGAGSTGNFTFRPYLKDTSNVEIWFTRNKEGQSDKSFTEDIDGSRIGWRSLAFPVGDHTGNPTFLTQKNGYWHGVADETFDWANVKYIGFQIITTGAMDTLYIDALSIPTVEAVARATNVVAGTDTRMYKEYRKDIGSQKRLDAYCAKVLELKRTVVQKFKAVAKGQVGTLYVSQYVHIRAPGYGVAALTRYDIVAIHHKLHHGVDVRGWEYITEYDLAAAESQDIRVLGPDNYRAAQLREQSRLNRIIDGAIMDDEYWVGGIQTGWTPQIKRGTPFPLDMNDGDEFFLTADLTVGPNEYYGPALYKYDDLAVDWIRNPIVMHRGADPNNGGEVLGDTLHRTDQDKWYQWTGALPWTLINFAAESISGEVIASQLAIEQRDWHSNLNFIWDHPNKDWDEIWWGIAGDEKNTNATIEFSDGTTVVVNKGTEGALGDGAYIYYWNDALVPGGPYTLVRDTFANWDNGVGAGKGIIFVVVIDEAGKNSPSFYPFNSYMATVGVGMLSAWTVKTHHLTAEEIYGKDIATQTDVGIAAGNPGIRMLGDASDLVTGPTAIGDAIGGNFTAGIWGFKAGPIRTYYLDPATGIIWVYGSGMFGLKTYPGNVTLGYLDATIVDLGLGTGNQNTLVVRTAVAGQVLMLESGGRPMYLDEATDQIILGDGWLNMRPMGPAGVDLGTNLVPFGDIWGVPKYNDLNLLDTHCPRCGERFKACDDIKFTVIAAETLEDSAGTPYEQIRCVPVHVDCSLIARMKRWAGSLLGRRWT